MIVFVYRDAESEYDCTNNGISNRYTRLCIVNVDGPFEPDNEMAAAMLVSNAYNSVKVVPARKDAKGNWKSMAETCHHMFGGNYCATSDSRWNTAIEKILGHRFYGAVPIHDRVE